MIKAAVENMRYIYEIPRCQPGDFRVIVHNRVRGGSKRGPNDDFGPEGTDRESGENGFRFWTDYPNDRLEECNCGWSGLKHYRIKDDCLFTGR